MSQKLLSSCPICRSNELLPQATIQDFYTTQENFQLTKCGSCEFLFTNPQPEPETLWKYYDSENYVSHSKTTKGFINYWYRQIQQINLSLKFKAINSHVPRGTWLDYGAGAGDFVNYMRNKNYEIIGIEPSETARLTAFKNGIELRDTSNLAAIEKGSISCITLWHVLEHIPDFTNVLNKLSDLLKSNGVLVLALPNYNSLDAQVYGENWAAYDVPRHLWHFKETDIANLAKFLNLDLIDKRGMIFDSLYVSLLSEKYQNGSKLTGIWNGIKSNVSAIQKKTPFSSQIYILKKKGF